MPALLAAAPARYAPGLADAAVRDLAPLPLALPPAAAARVAREAAGEVLPAKRPPLGWRLRQRLKLLRDGSYLVPLYARAARRLGLAVMYGELWGRVLHADGTATDYGLLGRRVVTDAGVAYLAGCFDNTNEAENQRYHGFGTGATAENANQTALVTELTTEYATNSTRPTGSQAKSANTYTTVATLSPDSGGTLAITEHGVFSATSGTTLLDRTVFSAINLVAGSDSLQATYVLTLPSGG